MVSRRKVKHISKLAKTYLQYKRGTIVCAHLPTRIWLEPTDHCNLKCGYCANKDIPSGKKGFMEMDLYRKIIDQLEENTDINLFHRGESLLHPRIVEMVTYAKKNNLHVRIHTNATRLTSELSSQLIEAGLDFISFSFDGFDKATYEKNRVGATFEKTVDNINMFLKERKKMESNFPHTIIQAIDVFDASSRKMAEIRHNFTALFSDNPPDKIVLRDLHNWGGNIDILTREELEKSGKHLIKCTFPWYAMTIFWNGQVVPCCQDFMGEIPVGDLTKQSVKEIWNGPVLQQLREQFVSLDYSHNRPCRACDRVWRKTFFGIPTDYLKSFIRESIIKVK